MSFYDDGLRFSCRHCGSCCKGVNAYVWIDHNDLERLSKFLDISVMEFRRVYTEIVDKAVALKSFPNGDCVFYGEEIGCRVHSARPLQCSSFPFWPEYLRDEHSWEIVAKRCPGVNSGELHSKEEIEKFIDKNGGF